jgi:hypothetical protein
MLVGISVCFGYLVGEAVERRKHPSGGVNGILRASHKWIKEQKLKEACKKKEDGVM